jgi:hypothetical protein
MSLVTGASLLALAQGSVAAQQGPRPMFAHGINRRDPLSVSRPLATLPTWILKWTYSGTMYHATFVGTSPLTGTATHVPVYIIPVKLTYGTTVADPTAPDYTGISPVATTLNSPLFQTGIDYRQGVTDVGNTQYEDAYQRANLWGFVKTHPNYHVLLNKPAVKPVQSITVPTADGSIGNPFGLPVIIANINWIDPLLQKLLTKLKIPAGSLPIFIMTQSYLSGDSGLTNCCIGGYHSYDGTQAYAQFTYISNQGAGLQFSQDVSAASHEIGEWIDDPLVNNTAVPALCGTQGNGQQIYEVGDPTEVGVNYGDYAYSLNNVTYHLQDMVLPSYFGVPKGVSIPFNQSFQGAAFSVCQNGG